MNPAAVEERIEALERETSMLRRRVGLLTAAVVLLLIAVVFPEAALALFVPFLCFGIALAVLFLISGIMTLLDLIWGRRPQAPGPPEGPPREALDRPLA